ncbi:Kelch-like protein [Dirofilaria immitis]
MKEMSKIRFLHRTIYTFLLHSILGTNLTLESENDQNTMYSQKLSMAKIDDCISKIRTIASVNPNFRNNIDRLAQIVQYDEIDKMLRNKMLLMCTEEEISAMTAFLDEENASIQIIQQVAKNMTKDERNFVDSLENTNNLPLLRNFYLNKYNAYGMVSEEEKLIAFIKDRMAATNFTDTDKHEIEQYLKSLFLSLKLD